MINEKKVEQVRKFVWDMYTELRKMRGKRKKIDIFAVEMTMMQLGCLANGMQEKEKESYKRQASSFKQRLTMVQGSCRMSILTNTGEINGQ
jgi:hypothetical protein